MPRLNKPVVKARNLRGVLDIEVWSGIDETEKPSSKYVALRIVQNGKTRSWIMIEPDDWTRLKSLVDERLTERLPGGESACLVRNR